jgi:hypothetical protein
MVKRGHSGWPAAPPVLLARYWVAMAPEAFLTAEQAMASGESSQNQVRLPEGVAWGLVTRWWLRLTLKLAMAGIDPRTIQELGGWATLAMAERYTHLSPSHKLEAVEKIAARVPTLFTTPSATVVALSR